METVDATMAALIADARALASSGRRRILGITGAPGAGKSTLADRIVDGLDGLAVLVPMDGFHLSNEVLVGLGRRDRKGAPDTFDAAGFFAMLERIRHASTGDEPVYAPRFVREIEESIGSSIVVPAGIPLVVTEGNYLLLDDAEWGPLRGSLDEVWFVDVDDSLRQERLMRRHEAFGKSAKEATAWTLGTDQLNAELVEATASRADRVIRISG